MAALLFVFGLPVFVLQAMAWDFRTSKNKTSEKNETKILKGNHRFSLESKRSNFFTKSAKCDDDVMK